MGLFFPFANTHLAIPCTSEDGTPCHVVYPSAAWHGWIELALYLGPAFHPEWVKTKDEDVAREFHAYPSADEFYHESERYLYHLTQYFIEGWKYPGYGLLFQVLAHLRQPRVLDFGCGIGSDGLWFMDAGVQVNFADFDSPCRRYLAWRIEQRSRYPGTQVYDLETETIPLHDVVWAMDVLEHLPPNKHQWFLDQLALTGTHVVMNLVDDKQADGQLHHPVDVEALTAYIRSRWDGTWRDFHHKTDGGKVRFITFWPQGLHGAQTGGTDDAVARAG